MYLKNDFCSLVTCCLVCSVFLSACRSSTLHSDQSVVIRVDTFSILSKVKLELTKQYCEENYGEQTYRLASPKMIVVHYTVIPTLDKTLNYFKRDSIEGARTISRFSALNVGIHYVVDRDGKIYNLLPDNIVARHVIGFNHVALGIENVAKDSTDLTDLQLKSNVALIRFLRRKYSTIQYLIGHEEYNNAALPHYKLYRALNEKYAAHDKSDPGPWFMKKIRRELLAERLNFEN
ncbi:MAG TPA: peptidoglycan recognition family protein [Cyclobacteriaceae bacterium]|jgi:N-acetylmuramoyl-L-alanine amidase|nr:peptidoglycan recognition family protein [Cyclobacteriaceae bacterium]